MKKITREDVKKFVDEHITMHSTFIDLGGADYRLVYENGDSYEWRSRGDLHQEHVTTILNNEMMNECIWESGWLENGNYGKKLISENA